MKKSNVEYRNQWRRKFNQLGLIRTRSRDTGKTWRLLTPGGHFIDNRLSTIRKLSGSYPQS